MYPSFSWPQEPQPGSQDAADEGGGGKDDTHANLDAWTQLTTVGGGSSGSGSASRGGSGSEGGAGGGAAQQQGGRQDEQAAAQQGQQTGGSAAGSGSQQGGPGLGAASGYVTIELKVPKVCMLPIAACCSRDALDPSCFLRSQPSLLHVLEVQG